MINFNENKNKGFTLIELLVALTLFSIIIISMSSITLSVMKSQRKAFAIQGVEESSRYILESIIKEIRMSVINTNSGSNLSLLNVTNSDGETVMYRFSGGKLSRRVNTGAWQDLSPNNIDLTGSFYIRKSSSPNRALVTILMKIKSKNSKIEEQSEIYIQNSINSRSN